MKFAIITHASHKLKSNKMYAYEPYVREMNLWLKYVSETKIVAPVLKEEILKTESNYVGNTISLHKISSFNILTKKNVLLSIFKIPFICYQIFKAMLWADHIHLRCPGNIGLLGCFVQILFPFKQKTAKYAGNWDPKSKQPVSYKIQKWILSNTFLTKNCKVLVYGKWENQTKNILPFFTASYTEKEIVKIPKKTFTSKVKFIFVGTFSKGKQPLLSVKVIEKMLEKNMKVQLDMYGNGEEYSKIANYIEENNLEKNIFLHGNQSKETVKKAYHEAHFLIFISKSEGWPKVVAEAMFWGCLPISSKVSCVENMLGFGERGATVDANVSPNSIVEIVMNYIYNEEYYQETVLKAKQWSQEYTLDTFENEIQKLLLNE